MKLILLHLDIVAKDIDVLFIPTLNADNRTSRVLSMYGTLRLEPCRRTFFCMICCCQRYILICLDLGRQNRKSEQYWQTLITVFKRYDPAACNYVEVGRHLIFNWSKVFVFVCFRCFYPKGVHTYMICSCMYCTYIYYIFTLFSSLFTHIMLVTY